MAADLVSAALALHRAGRIDDACAVYERLLVAEPARADVLHLLGIGRYQRGNAAAARRTVRLAVAVEPATAHLHVALGGLTVAAGDAAGGLAAYRRGVRLDPAHAEANGVLADRCLDLGRPAEAAAAARRALAADPGQAGGHYRLAEAERAVGRLEVAARLFAYAARLDPADVRAPFRLAATLERLQRPDAAARAYRACLMRDPQCVEALFNIANQLSGQSDGCDRSRRLYRAAVTLRPEFAAAFAGIGTVLLGRNRMREAIPAFRRALALEPGQVDVYVNMGNALKAQGRVEETVAVLRHALALDPARHTAFSNLLFALCFKEDMDGETLLAWHRAFDESYVRPLHGHVRPHANEPDPHRRLRIGFVSPGFRRHPSGYSLLPFMANRDRGRFEVFCYYNGTYQDDLTRQFRALSDHWHVCWGEGDAELAERIRADGIDILVDCVGHLADGRLMVFARKPAPVQVSYPVYPATTGVSTIDYRIMDVHFAPPDAERMHSERLVRLPDCHVCYRPLDFPVEPAADLPMRCNGHVTFASFNNFAKVGERTVALWAELLERVPTARLRLKWQGLATADREAVLAPFVRRGIDPDRIHLSDWAPDPYSPYRDVDLCLDPVHANGGTTTFDALWMGVPVVTLAGAMPFSRVGLCHLSNVGLSELVARTPEEYLAIAAGFAADPERLAALRRGLRERFAASPLMDAPRYARSLERAFLGMWEAWCRAAWVAPPGPADAAALDRRVLVGLGHHKDGRLAEAAAVYRGVLCRMPEHYDALQLLGVATRQGGDDAAAAVRLDRAIRLRPLLSGAIYNRGLALRGQDRLDAAAAAFRAAVVVAPGEGGAYVSLGTVEQGRCRTVASEAAYRRAVALDPADAAARMNLAWVLLITGRLREGWEAFEWRWRRSDFTSPLRPFTQPQWTGGDLAGRTILLHAEQGYGDTLQFLRYVPLVAARGGRVVLECPAALAPLAAAVPGVTRFVTRGEELPPFDLHCPLMSLPRAFGTTLEEIPGAVPYLRPDPQRVARWRARMAEGEGGDGGDLRVGLLWAGNPGFKGDRDRSPRLRPLLPLFEVPGVRFFGLQMGDGRQDMAGLALPRFTDLGAEIGDFGDSAAIMANLDLVISSCTAPAHLAGALGVPLWVLLPFSPDWRWLLEREDSPWYPTARLFRQPRRGDWATVVERVRAALAARAAASLGA